VFVDVFSMTDLCHQDHKGIIMNFINNSIISRSDFVKIVVALHFCCSRVRQVFSKSINFSLYSSQFLFGKLFQVFFNIGSELYVYIMLKAQLFPELLGRNVLTRFFNGLHGIGNIYAVF